ncbi:Vps51/Vps67 [Ancylostoma caninum]|uniref:Vps51/Vps67 n=1 Tax=Ancylostoma caninum TaxID=29170 RepID=A0A368G6V0_ANCCA|nr:Vps51/Vps67 [Ancylostoma caninum]
MQSGDEIANSGDAVLMSDNFSPSEYIRDRLKGVRTGDETKKLQALRTEMNAINHASQELLKNNVFQNYQQFIDASKEISHLEQEIYQLSSLLLDQKQLIENLMQMTGDDKSSVQTASSHSASAASITPIQVLMQKMDGVAGILNNMRSSDKVLLYGEMMLLDPETKEDIHRAMLVLLSDRLLIGNITPSGKYSLESTFSLNNLAVVNVKDRESGPAVADQLLKLLVFPEQRYYRCDSARVKKMWLDELERAKREILHEGILARQTTIRGKRMTVQERAKRTQLSPNTSKSLQESDEGEVNQDEMAWLQELPAELDDCIAHRDLDQAVELIHEWKQCSTKDTNIDAQLKIRENQIVQLLSDDVRRPGAVHGGPRAMKKARTLLAQLGRGTYAMDLYLRRRSALQRAAVKDIAVSEEPLSYVRQLCTLFSGAVTDVASEFHSQPQYYCQVLQWCSGELSMLLSLVRRHVIEVAPAMTVLAFTWGILMKTMDELTAMGVQLTFEVHRLLAPALEAAIETNFSNIMQGVKLRMTEERWRPYALESESALSRLVEELSDVGLNIDWTVASDSRAAVLLSPHAIHFARVAHSLARDLAPLRRSPARSACDRCTFELWNDYLRHLSASICDSTVYAYTATFILTQVLPLCETTLYCDDDPSDVLTRLLAESYPKLVPYAKDSEEEAIEEEEEVAHI